MTRIAFILVLAISMFTSFSVQAKNWNGHRSHDYDRHHHKQQRHHNKHQRHHNKQQRHHNKHHRQNYSLRDDHYNRHNRYNRHDNHDRSRLSNRHFDGPYIEFGANYGFSTNRGTIVYQSYPQQGRHH